jgi:hypothetical protein
LLALKDYETTGKDPVLRRYWVSNAHIWNTIGKNKGIVLFTTNFKASKTNFLFCFLELLLNKLFN